MKEKIAKILRRSYAIVVTLVLFVVLAGGCVYAATTIASSQITFNNSSRNISSTNVQGALDQLYSKAVDAKEKCPDNYKCENSSITSATTTSGSSTTCYKKGSTCAAGTAINYKVNSSETVPFYVMFDDGTTMIMQSRDNIVENTTWYDSGGSSGVNKNGPVTILAALESATAGWTNVNTQTYTMGSTLFANASNPSCSSSTCTSLTYTGCYQYGNSDISCASNIYSLAKRSAKARMITAQEAYALGCRTGSSQSACPTWLYDTLFESGSAKDTAYWTMNAVSTTNDMAWIITNTGYLNNTGRACKYTTYIGARAVVEVTK